MLLENKVAVVRAFAREGATVFLAGRTKAKPADEINSNGGSAATAAVDASMNWLRRAYDENCWRRPLGGYDLVFARLFLWSENGNRKAVDRY